ncbi:MAG: thiamine pyrophosphate-dependent dehydrogenase E1 component subunit alpha [Gammaproteobacteria bacterium]|jgi:pyruvate dehydrogenase E1 component alpha subunit|nr:thiamine pyrophosphate-dependent dehydrogenase E1 component subunit alpha [Gammaproteobacteria bacterium]MBP6051112.1 thiamine pyrophosphate-dependent dehydrogenase E1 component subunit alpha [Pseudomonadales bacterium]MBK6584216.1 thiamine pyrophosphate-dependent dehydrogenase E1 component subunit alpha [Gammaproteobacteria bacterium]MBK7520400.1 thiamine pyrophosphate-dependent dehydrogenase E1 component subunit alpha [Gammaproteobacteria bacterium]MBK7728112.1 thiamine pyrophosphate-depen
MNSEIEIEGFRRMLRIRGFEQAVTRLINEGEVPGACHSSIGQEAAVVGACMALRQDDYMSGTHRSHGHPIGKGADLKPLMAEILGKATGVCKGRGGSMHLTDTSVGSIGESAIVGGGISLATGAALSAQVRGTDQVALSFFGDGAVNEGAFHESLNMAAVWKLPVIYFCENNRYAAVTAAASTHGQPDVARRAEGYGMPGVIVDGQDFEAVFRATAEAVTRARRGEGPTLIEAKTYRFDEHCVGLFVNGAYRPKEELERFKAEGDPVALFKAALLARGNSEAALAGIEEEVSRSVNAAVEFARESQFPDPGEAFELVYSSPVIRNPRGAAR